MSKLIKWLRARLFARRWAAMREAAAYRESTPDQWDYQARRRQR